MKKFTVGDGKSASFFFFPGNNEFVIKTLIGEELKTLTQTLLNSYHQHLMKSPDSPLIRFYAAFSITIK